MLTGMILLICMYPMVFIMYFIIKNEAVPKKNIIFGVTLTDEQSKDCSILSIKKQYNIRMRWIFAAMMILPLIILVIPWASVSISIWMLWVIISVGIFFLPFVQANGQMKQLKEEKGWKKPTYYAVYTETKAAGEVRKVHFFQFVGPIVCSMLALIPVFMIKDESLRTVLLILVSTFALMTILFYGAAVMMDRQRNRVISQDGNVTVNYARARKNIWKNLWLTMAWANTVFTVSISLQNYFSTMNNQIVIGEVLIYSVVLALLLIVALKKAHSVDEMYKDRMDYNIVDDDDLWLWGMIYYNPKDRHFMIEKRVGMGNSINMASAGGKWFAGCMGLVVLYMLVMLIWVNMIQFTPIHLKIQDQNLVAVQVKNDYSIPIDSIEKVTILTTLPRLSREVGTGMENLEKGSFRVPEEGKCKVFLNPQNSLFIYLEADGVRYYLGGFDDEETQNIYDCLQK